MKKIGIYKITSPSGRIYIGQSIDINRRWVSYKKLNCKKQILLFNSLKKYGYENHVFEIVCECNKEELDYLEKHYIELFDCFDTDNGLNLKSGGEKPLMSDSIKKKISDANKGRKFTEEHKTKLSKSHKGYIHTKEQKEKIGLKSLGNKHNLGRVCKTETKEKMRLKALGRKISDEQKEKISNTLKGKGRSEETKEKIRQTMLKRRAAEGLITTIVP